MSTVGLLIAAAIYVLIPCAVSVVGIGMCIRKLRAAGKQFNYSLAEGLAAVLSLAPTAGIAAIAFLNEGTGLPGTGAAVGVGVTVLLVQLFAFVRVRTERLLEVPGVSVSNLRIPIDMLCAVGVLIFYWVIVLIIVICCFGVAG